MFWASDQDASRTQRCSGRVHPAPPRPGAGPGLAGGTRPAVFPKEELKRAAGEKEAWSELLGLLLSLNE